MLRWTLHLKGAPNFEYNVALTVRDKVYYFAGGLNNTDQIEVHVFNTVSLSWLKLPKVTSVGGERPLDVPPSRSGHTAVLIEATVYIWGGYNHHQGECFTDLHGFDINTHKWLKPEISGTVPEGRWYHSACVLGKVMYISGGYNQVTRRNINDMYNLDTTAMVWTLINTGGIQPPALSFHSATIIGTKMFVSGGMYGHDVLHNTIRVFDTKTNLWLSTPSTQLLPEGRCCHSAFAYNGELYIFGGCGAHDVMFNDMWIFSPETFSWKKVEPKGKGPSQTFWMCCCVVGDRTILFGGYHEGSKPADDLYILDFSPTLKTLSKLSVIQYRLEQRELPHDIKWELAAMSDNAIINE